MVADRWKIKMRFVIIILIFLISSGLNAQLYVSPGGVVGIAKGAMVTVKSMDAINSGAISHAGDMEVTGNIINSGRWTCDSTCDNRISLTLNWTNNFIFKPGLGRVEFNGANQNIGGSVENFFYKLMLRGVEGNKKTLLNHASCRDSLSLNKIELATNSNRLSLINASVPVQRISGYISTFNKGYVRTIFPQGISQVREIPLGYGTGSDKYRPIYTVNPARDSFDLQLIGNDPTRDGRNSKALQDSLCSINDLYYYGIKTYESNLFYGVNRTANEQYYTKLARWDTKKWSKLTGSGPTPFIGSPNLSFNSQAPATNEYIAQGRERPFIKAGEDVELNLRTRIVLKSKGYIPETASILWSPGADLTCPTCLNTVISPMAIPGMYTITISNGPKCIAIDSLKAKQNGVYNELIPNAFSPNADGINDGFGPVMYPGDKLLSIEIFNRWGEKLYKGTDHWDGTYQGSVVDQGVYMYIIYILRPGQRHFNLSGTLTVLH